MLTSSSELIDAVVVALKDSFKHTRPDQTAITMPIACLVLPENTEPTEDMANELMRVTFEAHGENFVPIDFMRIPAILRTHNSKVMRNVLRLFFLGDRRHVRWRATALKRSVRGRGILSDVVPVQFYALACPAWACAPLASARHADYRVLCNCNANQSWPSPSRPRGPSGCESLSPRARARIRARARGCPAPHRESRVPASVCRERSRRDGTRLLSDSTARIA
mmetsp:Transcript_45746/g.91252  ORF Transcript_45746/g.91252 Transcript_45746/m.91252 type:complete len:223 (-) Transcript_45746:518-1186(-)